MNNGLTLYVFLDEGGNFDFSNTGTRYFTLTCFTTARPFRLHTAMDTIKYDLIEFRKKPRIDLDAFHCAEDNRHIRAKLFSLFASGLAPNTVDAVIVEKSKTGPALRPAEKFFPKMLGYLLKYTIEKCPNHVGEVVVITDSIPVNQKRRAVEKAIKITLSAILPANVPYRLMHHSSKAHYGLQIADYFNWAIQRKWEKGDTTHYDQIRTLIRSEFEIFKTGQRHYY